MSGMQPIGPLLLVVSTLGRIQALDRLLSTVTRQLEEADELVVVAQGEIEAVRELLERYVPQTQATLTLSTSERGSSLGRNRGVAARRSAGTDPLIMFPNDTSWFAEGALDAIRRETATAELAAVSVLAEGEPRFMLPPPGSRLDARSVWSVIEMGLVIRLSLFEALGGFDEQIGTGSATPWQAGEGTDILLRAIEERPDLRNTMVWVNDANAWVGGVAETAGLSTDERRWKLRAYGRGVGHVYRIHPYPAWHRWGFVAAGLVIGLRRRSEYKTIDGLYAFTGRLEGVTGKTVGAKRDQRAVSR
tara:strand:+ start:3115 stop:4026 length:912 start_codon:yes stop_codon:yes gene_type:complete